MDVNFAHAYEHVWMLILLVHMSMCRCEFCRAYEHAWMLILLVHMSICRC